MCIYRCRCVCMQHRGYEYVCMGVGLCVIHVCVRVYVYVIHVCVWVICVCYTCVCLGVCVWVQTQICMSVLKRVAIVMISLFERVVFNTQLVNYLLIELD